MLLSVISAKIFLGIVELEAINYFN